MEIDQHTDWTTVYTADFAGVYMLDFSPRNNGNIQFRFSNDGGDTINSSIGLVRYLPAGTTIQHKGPAVELFGARLGNEF